MSEPFGYFKAEPFGWTDCAETDEGAIALYAAPPAPVRQEPTAKHTDQFESARVGDYNRGWNDCLFASGIVKQPTPVREDWGPGPHECHSLPAPEFVCSTGLCHFKSKRTWTGLTHDEWDAWQDKHGLMLGRDALDEIEAKLKEKNQ